VEKENEDDPDRLEMIASELKALSTQLVELEEKMKANTT
jgi:peptide chain release factor 1